MAPEEVAKLSKMQASIRQVTQLVDEILDLAKIEAGQTSVEIGPVTVAKVVAGVMEPLRAQAQDKGLQFNAVVEPGVPAFITSDAQRLAQILKNLLSNALKFTARGEVTMRVFAGDNDTLCFAVRDTGIGIAPDLQERIFDAFHQAVDELYATYTPEFAARESGVDAETIVRVARAVGDAGSALATHIWRNTAAGNLGGWQVARYWRRPSNRPSRRSCTHRSIVALEASMCTWGPVELPVEPWLPRSWP